MERQQLKKQPIFNNLSWTFIMRINIVNCEARMRYEKKEYIRTYIKNKYIINSIQRSPYGQLFLFGWLIYGRVESLNVNNLLVNEFSVPYKYSTNNHIFEYGHHEYFIFKAIKFIMFNVVRSAGSVCLFWQRVFLLLILLFALRSARPPDPRYAASFTHIYRPFQASLLGTARYLLGLWENYAPFRGPKNKLMLHIVPVLWAQNSLLREKKRPSNKYRKLIYTWAPLCKSVPIKWLNYYLYIFFLFFLLFYFFAVLFFPQKCGKFIIVILQSIKSSEFIM